MKVRLAKSMPEDSKSSIWEIKSKRINTDQVCFNKADFVSTHWRNHLGFRLECDQSFKIKIQTIKNTENHQHCSSAGMLADYLWCSWHWLFIKIYYPISHWFLFLIKHMKRNGGNQNRSKRSQEEKLSTVTFSIGQKACICSIYIAANEEMCLIESVNSSVESVYENADHRRSKRISRREEWNESSQKLRFCTIAVQLSPVYSGR